ncbi:Elongator complex protein 4 [Kalaharituber pfeilii]|nr:Elongator complex protein 4 [Kalaharituber pfeilii]
MRIAWRYERLAAGATGALGRPERGASSDDGVVGGRQSGEEAALGQDYTGPFCHSFDLTKRLEIPSGAKITFIPLLPPPLPSTSASTSAQPPSPFLPIVQKLHSILTASAQSHTPTIHRLLIPSLLCPPLYPPHSSLPRHTLQFLHTLRALLRRHPATLTAMLSLPLKLHPRDTGLVRWAEHLCDAVIELVPLPSLMEKASAAAAKGRDDIPMGLVRIWKVPGGTGVLGGRGAAAAAEVMGEDLAFTMTRKRFGIMRYSLPPAEGEEGESGNGGGSGGRSGGTKGAEGGGGKTTKVDIEF